MKKTAISVTEAARNFADCVKRVHYQKVTFVLLKNGVAVAQLGPGERKICAGSDLAEALGEAELPVAEARLWRKDLRRARRKLLKGPGDKRRR
jgi:antitoxin (DNA-binding transcriptional repressor) of toxin-antitoxin stability system